jgi:hypothetical protein
MYLLRKALFVILIIFISQSIYPAETDIHNILTALLLTKNIEYRNLDELADRYSRQKMEKRRFYQNISDENKRMGISAIIYAVYIALDETERGRNLASRASNEIKKIGIHVPELDEILTPGSGSLHHKYTHQGWTYDYRNLPNEYPDKSREYQKKWERRKNILLDTLDKTLTFSLFDKLSGKVDSLGAILYYSHVLADLRYNSTSNPEMNYLPQTSKIGEELIYSLERLFGKPQPGSELEKLVNDIKNSQRVGLANSGGDLYPYAIAAENMINSLNKYFPTILEKEKFYVFKNNSTKIALPIDVLE